MYHAGTARFTCQPQRIEDLNRTSAEASEHSYEIVMRVQLETIDYVRFTSNMVAHRSYLTPYEDLCSTGNTFKCLLVFPEGFEAEGILVIPGSGSGVAYAAYP